MKTYGSGCTACFTPSETPPRPPRTNSIGYWVGPRAGLGEETDFMPLSGIELRLQGRPARSLVFIPTVLVFP
jgi:hypothetical protein